MNPGNLLALVFLVAALAFFLFGLLIAAGPVLFHAEFMIPELESSVDLPLDVRSMAEELLGSGSWALGCSVVFFFGVPAALLAAAGLVAWWWLGCRQPVWTGRGAVLGFRGGGLLSFLAATFFVLWCGLLILQAPTIPVIDEATGNPLRANVYGAVAFCGILALLSSTFGAGLLG